MSIEKTLTFGEHTVEIDDWGGIHIHYPEGHDEPLSYSPETMREIEQARQEVIE